MAEPQEMDRGRNGKWEVLGYVGVDSASIAITDPAFAPSTEAEREANWQRRMSTEELASPYGNARGVQFMSGFGDGSYRVWGWVADYSKEGEREDKRIAQVVITLITPDDFTDWHHECDGSQCCAHCHRHTVPHKGCILR